MSKKMQLVLDVLQFTAGNMPGNFMECLQYIASTNKFSIPLLLHIGPTGSLINYILH